MAITVTRASDQAPADNSDAAPAPAHPGGEAFVYRRAMAACGRLFEKLYRLYLREFPLMERQVPVIGWFGVIGFPTFWAVWTFLVPQPYESLTMRLIAVAISLPFALVPLLRRVPALTGLIERGLPIGFFVAVLICVPQHFTYMALMNEFNPVWHGSMMAATLLLFLLLDPANAFVCWFLGSASGMALWFAVSGQDSLPIAYNETLPIYGFVVAGSMLFGIRRKMIEREQIRAMAAIGGGIAHEMRTPLLSMRLDLDGLKRHMGKLDRLERQIGQSSPEEVTRLLKRWGEQQEPMIERLVTQIRQANAAIDILLANIDEGHIDARHFSVHSVTAVVNDALDAYPFRPGEGERTEIVLHDDFAFYGSDVLMRHVIFNLLKNTLRALRGRPEGKVWIEIAGGERNRLTVIDNGAGIARDELDLVFERFWSGERAAGGAGIGLHLCREIIEAFGGRIGCESELGRGTTFTISLPRVTGVSR